MTTQHEESWRWDASLFAGAVGFYERGRLPYAAGLAAAMQAALALDGTGRLLDVGCGPGTVTLQLAHLFAEAVGLDPDADMLAQAQHLAAARGITNAQWAYMRGEDLPGNLGSFRAVTFAASLHWLDRQRVFAVVKGMLELGGAVVHVDNPGYRQEHAGAAGAHYPPPPEVAMDTLRIAYLGADRRAGQGIRNTSPGDEDRVFVAAGFAGPTRLVVPDGRVLNRSIDDLIAERFSMSATAPHLFGARRAAYEADLRTLLLKASPAGFFSVRLSDNVLKIWQRSNEGR